MGLPHAEPERDRELGTRLAVDRKRVEVTSAFAAGGAVLLLLGGALSSYWFRRAL